MRVSMQCGRMGSARHNDRDFDVSHADNIHVDKTGQNRVVINPELTRLIDGRVPLVKYEMLYYEHRYARAQDAKNAMYIKEGHASRCKKVIDLYTSKRYRPEEMILQVGDASYRPEPKDFENCVRLYMTKLAEWNRAHGGHMKILDVAFHYDETTPHAHMRRVWETTDRHGFPCINMNRALEEAGVPLPDPSKPEGRYNNRKMSFDVMARELWQEVVMKIGFDIETEPRQRMRHKATKDYQQSCVDTVDKQLGDIQKAVERLVHVQNTAIAKADFDTMRQVGLIADDLTSFFGLGREQERTQEQEWSQGAER